MVVYSNDCGVKGMVVVVVVMWIKLGEVGYKVAVEKGIR